MSLLFGRKPRWVVHPTLIASAYVLSAALASDVEPAGYLRALAGGVLFAATLTVACWAILRNRWDGALLATGIIVAVVSPASLAWTESLLRDLFGPSMATPVAAAGITAVLGVIGIRILQSRHRHLPFPRPAPETLNVASVAIVAAVIGSNLFGLLALTPSTPLPLPAGWRAPASGTPDMIVILLDGYPRSDVLNRRLGTHNEAFLSELGRRGFDVAKKNQSNYTATWLTLPSMFQMRYIDQTPSLRPLLETGKHEAAALRDATESGLAFSILRAAGYEVTMSAPGWEQVTYRKAPDRLLDSGEMTDIEEWLLHRTWFLYPLDVVWPDVFTSSRRDRIVHSFDALDGFAAEHADHPRFLFLHVPAPHLPLVVEADGTPTALSASRFDALGRSGYGMTDSEYSDAWQAQVTYVNDRVIQGIDQLLGSARGREAVIVVLSDHGYNFEARADDPQARLANLLAARTPNAPNLVGDSVTPVNLFRILFNRYLGTEFPLLPNRYFLHGQRPMDLTEIEDPDQTPAPS